MRVSEEVLRAFGIAEEPTALEGGEGRAWRAGDRILKPCDDPAEWAWLGERLPKVDQRGFRLALPLRAGDGRWVVGGWCAQAAVVGEHAREGRWAEVLETGEAFHRAVRELPRPPFIDARTHPWSVGDRVAWGETEVPVDSQAIQPLLGVRRPIALASQLVHGDLTGNVLFAAGRDPAVIDVTPYWRPVGFASAVVVADAICWHGADPEPLLEAVAHLGESPQLFVRALLFRMVTTIGFARERADFRGYQPAVDLALRLAGRG